MINFLANLKNLSNVFVILGVIKQIKEYLDSTHLDEEVIAIISDIKKDFEKLAKKIPAIKEAIPVIIAIIKGQK